MRNVRWTMAVSGLAVFGALGWVMGCSASSQEDLTDPTLGRQASTSTSGTGGEGGQSPTSSSSSGAGGMAPGCLPTDPTFVSDMCGVFVALAGKAGAAGTMTDPLPSLAAGIDAAVASNKYVFACTDTFNERVRITSGLAIYGGREDCAKSWALKPDGATTVNGLVDSIALIIETPQHVTLENVDVVASAATMTSTSSISVLVSQAEAEFKNCKFTSQDAFKGEDGAIVPSDPALNGTPGSPGKAVCAAGLHPGGIASVKTCGGATSTGGKGGNGAAPGAMSAGNGADGTLSSPAGIGAHGNGQTSAATCTTGGYGSDGSNGADGAGAIGIGSISASGYTGASGGVGGTGTPGIGGGGGGGSRGTSVPIMACNTSSAEDYYGASGGSGGSGGCGGKPGNVGGSGGSSIALLVVNAKSVKLDTVTLTPGQGGKGGTGGPGQTGGSQGSAGPGGDSTDGGGLKVGCAGGPGGPGGSGGPGGGGQGGHSLGLAFKGTAPTGAPIFPQTMPKPGAGGDAGANAKDPKVGKGIAGNSTAPASYTLEFK